MTRSVWQSMRFVAMVTVAMAGATTAAAQSPPPRVEFSANIGALAGLHTLEASRSFSSNGNETATLTTDHRAKMAVPFSVGGAARIVRQLWLGAQYTMADTRPGASVSAVIPHPLLFSAPRTVQGTVGEVVHNERNVHVNLMYAVPVGAMDVKVMAGPTLFSLEQDFVSDVALTETYPFDTATFAGATTKQLSKSEVGFNTGVDVSYPVSSTVGIGALIRYSRANVKFADPDVGRQSVRVGGVEAGVGIRIRF